MSITPKCSNPSCFFEGLLNLDVENKLIVLNKISQIFPPKYRKSIMTIFKNIIEDEFQNYDDLNNLEDLSNKYNKTLHVRNCSNSSIISSSSDSGSCFSDFNSRDDDTDLSSTSISNSITNDLLDPIIKLFKQHEILMFKKFKELEKKFILNYISISNKNLINIFKLKYKNNENVNIKNNLNNITTRFLIIYEDFLIFLNNIKYIFYDFIIESTKDFWYLNSMYMEILKDNNDLVKEFCLENNILLTLNKLGEIDKLIVGDFNNELNFENLKYNEMNLNNITKDEFIKTSLMQLLKYKQTRILDIDLEKEGFESILYYPLYIYKLSTQQFKNKYKL